MTTEYQPFRDLRSPEDLLLVRREFTRRPTAVKLPEPYFGEFCAWVTVEGTAEELLSQSGQLLWRATREGAAAWRLLITPHGYLRFEAETDPPLVCESKIPLHCFLTGNKRFRVGIAMGNYSWLLRDSEYAAEADSYGRLRLLISPTEKAPFAVCGGRENLGNPLFGPVPQGVEWQEEGVESLHGRISGFTAYQTERFEMVDPPRRRSADDVMPPIPGGGGFAPRWTAEDTIEVFGRPEFTQTTSYWFLLGVNDRSRKLRRVRLQPVWSGSANMTPTFFSSTDGRRWRRIAPERIEMCEDGTNIHMDVALTPRQAQGCLIASAIPFLETDRREFIEWATEKLGAQVEVCGKSVEGRPVELVRVAPRRGEALRHVAITCGQHSPAETMGAHVLRPMLTEARRLGLLDKIAFHLVPTVNVDCAHYGGNGLNANQRNTNRHWLHDLQPETQAVISYFESFAGDGGALDFALDLHAGGIFRNHLLMHMAAQEGEELPAKALAQQEQWRDWLETHAGLRRADGTGLAIQRLRATDYFLRRFGCPAFCLELSTCSYFDPEAGVSKPFEQRALQIVGKGLARAMAEWV